MTIEIISPEKLIYKGEADALQLPGADGSFGILKDHAPIIATLKKGQVKVTRHGKDEFFDVDGGVVEVLRDRVIVLSE